MKNNIELYNIAKQFIGNKGESARKYCGLPASAAWCCAFVCWIFNLGGDAKLFYGGKKVTYCPTAIKWCQANLANIPIYLAMPMDVIFFDWNNNGTADHIGFVRGRVSDQKVNTIEGNTNGGVVANKTRPEKYVLGCYRPNFPASFKIAKLDVDGQFGYNSIAMLQTALKKSKHYKGKVDGILGKQTIKALQARAGVAQDGSWGKKTSKAVQKMIGVTQDGWFGENSVKALQTWINKQCYGTPLTAPQKITSKAKVYCWPLDTDSKKWAYNTGSPLQTYVKALKKYMNKNSRVTQSDCGYFVSTCVRASGVAPKFKALAGTKEPFPAVPSSMKVVHSGKKIPDGLLKAGDIIRYKKTNGGQHTMIYYSNGVIAEAGREKRFPVLRKDKKKYNADSVRHSTIQVLRAK